MGRRVAVAGTVLAVVGLLLDRWAVRAALAGGPDQLDEGTTYLVGLLSLLAATCTAAGAVMVGLGLFTVLTGQALVRPPQATVLWTGVGLVVAAAAVEFAAMAGPILAWASQDQGQAWFVALVQALYLVKLVGAVLLGLWLAGLLAHPGTPLRRERHTPPLEPSRPF